MGTRHGTMSRRRLGIFASVVLAGSLALAACSGGDRSDASNARSKSDDRSASAEVAGEVPESAALCAIFSQLAASGAGPGAQFNATTPEGWAKRIATNEAMVAAAPPAWRDEAETYLQMVKDRAQLAAENGYVGVNELIAYMGQECDAIASG